MTADLFALLTRIKLSRAPTDLVKAARQQHLFVLVGLVVGLVASLVGIVLLKLLGEDQPLVYAGILMVAMYYVTGILHTEGLADFADGVMASGTAERKRQAMKDVHLGVAGVFAVVMYLVLTYAVLATLFSAGDKSLEPWPLPWGVPIIAGLVLSEVAGKLAMNVTMYLGPSSHQGMGSLFVDGASAAKMVTAILLASAIGFLVGGWLVSLLAIGVLAGVAVAMLARSNFGGVSGDAFGASNEVGRIATLLAWVLLI
jgi:adenosylcobinamide-GDP ribazoletransferase